MAFCGFPAEAFEFYDGLTADNTKAFWTDHKGDYERFVREPMLELSEDAAPLFGTGHLYRPYRDVRFSRDKTPFKDHQGLFIEYRNGLGWYLQVSSAGLMVAGGWYASTPEQVARYRQAVAADEAGLARTLLDDAQAKGLSLGGNQLKTRPRDYPADHPRIDLLRFRSMYLRLSWEPEAWMGTPKALQRITQTWTLMTPVMDWLATAVGPGAAPVGRAARR